MEARHLNLPPQLLCDDGAFAWAAKRRSVEEAVADAIRYCRVISCKPYAINDALGQTGRLMPISLSWGAVAVATPCSPSRFPFVGDGALRLGAPFTGHDNAERA